MNKILPMAAGTLVSFLIGATAQEPLKSPEGVAVIAVEEGAKVWSDRDYTFTAWPEVLRGAVSVQGSIRGVRFEAASPATVVVLAPETGDKSLIVPLLRQGFEWVDVEPFHPYRVNADRLGNRCVVLQKQLNLSDPVELGYYGIAARVPAPLPVRAQGPASMAIGIPTVDISGDTHRHSFVARGTPEVYQGHVDTVLMPDGKIMFAAWAINHAGHLGPLARSDDAGLTWEMIKTPANWWEVGITTPTIHRLVDPQGVGRLFVFGGLNFPGRLRHAYSEDGGMTWSPMTDTGLKAECPPKDILEFDGGKRLVMWCDRRDPESTSKADVDPVVWQSESTDGGLTWSPERVVVKVPTRWAQPAVIRDAADENRLVMLLRTNGAGNGRYAVSTDGARTWSEAMELPAALTGHRPVIRRAPDGRLVVAMRDTAAASPTRGHFVAWVGTFDDIVEGWEGQYRIKLLHSHAGSDTGYSGLEVLPDGTFIATTYIKYVPGPDKHSVVCTRFNLPETDAFILPVGMQ